MQHVFLARQSVASRLTSQLIKLLRNTSLRPSEAGKFPSTQFFAGATRGMPFGRGIALSWWFNDQSRSALNAAASLTTSVSPEFSDCDPETVADVILTTLQQICVDSRIFSVDDLVFSRKPTLFDCVSGDIVTAAEFFSARVQESLREKLGAFCTVFAIPRFTGPSFSVAGRGLHFVEKGDSAFLRSMTGRGFSLPDWWSDDSAVRSRVDPALAVPAGHDSLLLIEGTGTRLGTRLAANLQSREFFAVAFAAASASSPHQFSRSMAQPFGYCVQFPHDTNTEAGFTRQDSDPIVPYYTDTIPLQRQTCMSISDWYANLDRRDSAIASRIQKAGHFFNLGMNSRGTESYINYFVSLDALLGVRGSVESSILEGLRKLAFGEEDVQRTKWLFELRSELVHGGSRYIEEWSRYPGYVRHCKTHPINDVQKISRNALLRAPIGL